MLLLALCLVFSLGITAFAASYSGDGAYRGLSGIQPNDSLTLPDNTASGDTGIIAEEKTSAAKFTNSKSSAPKTGEDNSMMLEISLMAVSALGMAGTLLSVNNKRRKPGHGKNR